MNVSIYILKDPLTMEVRYVGRTKNLLNVRLNGHVSKSKANKFKTHKDNWILSLPCKPIIEQIETVFGWDESYKREQEVIKSYIDLGFRLTNLHDRGCGGLLRSISDDMKTRISSKIKKLHEDGLLSCNKKAVDVYDLFGNFITTLDSYKKCAEFVGVSEKHIQNSMRRKSKRLKSYQIRPKGSLPPGVWRQRTGEISKNFKSLFVFDIEDRSIKVFASIKEAKAFMCATSNGFYYYTNKSKLFKGRFIIANARVKLDELLESLTGVR
jgi:hypothetical protein